MKKILVVMLAMLALTISAISVMADEDQQQTRTGTVIIIDTKYYLDVHPLGQPELGDGVWDIYLDFGPSWWSGPPGPASRPSDGDQITVFGKLTDEGTPDAEMDVYEINGMFWRNPGRPPWAGANPARQGPKPKSYLVPM